MTNTITTAHAASLKIKTVVELDESDRRLDLRRIILIIAAWDAERRHQTVPWGAWQDELKELARQQIIGLYADVGPAGFTFTKEFFVVAREIRDRLLPALPKTTGWRYYEALQIHLNRSRRHLLRAHGTGGRVLRSRLIGAIP